jgi:hypothetical protein
MSDKPVWVLGIDHGIDKDFAVETVCEIIGRGEDGEPQIRILSQQEAEERRPGFFEDKEASEFGEGVEVQGVFFVEPEEDTEEHGIYTVTDVSSSGKGILE